MGFKVKAIAPGFAERFREIGEVFEITDPKVIDFVKAKKSQWLVPAPADKQGQKPDSDLVG